MDRDITVHRMREFIGKSLQGQFGPETGDIMFDAALELQTATTKTIAEIEAAIQASFDQIIKYGKRIQDDVKAREDVKGKFA